MELNPIDVIKDWQSGLGFVLLALFLNGKFKSILSAIKYHRHDKFGRPTDSNGKELFTDEKIL